MAKSSLTWALVAAAALSAACSHPEPRPAERAPPAASGSAEPVQQKRRESKEPPTRDPSTKPPAGYRRMAVGGLAPTSEGNAVVLMDDTARRGLVLYVSGTEALSIALRLEHRRLDRPLTHDLLDGIVRKLGGDVVSVRVDRIEDEVFYGSVLLTKEGRLLQLDARPSDALALAIGNAVPVFVAEAVLEQAGIDVEKFDFRKLRQGPEKKVSGMRAGEVEL